MLAACVMLARTPGPSQYPRDGRLTASREIIMRRVRPLLTTVFAIATALSVAAVSPQAAQAHVRGAQPAAGPSGAGTTPLTGVRPGSAQAQAMRRGMEAKLAARQAASVAPRSSRAEAGAIPVVQAKA